MKKYGSRRSSQQPERPTARSRAGAEVRLRRAEGSLRVMCHHSGRAHGVSGARIRENSDAQLSHDEGCAATPLHGRLGLRFHAGRACMSRFCKTLTTD